MTKLKAGTYCVPSIREELFDIKYTNVIKAFGILLMMMSHILNPEWMLFPVSIIDIKINMTFLSAIIARGGDICIGIFAFITGYGWVSSFGKKSIHERIFGIGGGYWSYWLILILFSFPFRCIISLLYEGGFPQLEWHSIILSLFAISSPSIKFQWYIYFLAFAILTYSSSVKLVGLAKCRAVCKIYIVCFISLILRILSRVFFTRVFESSILLSMFSHYFQWMPVVICGSIVNKSHLFDEFYFTITQKYSSKSVFCWSIVFAIVIYLGKCFFQYFSGVYSNFDSFLILPFMFCIIVIAKYIVDNKMKFIFDVFSLLGKISMYLWLMHSIMLSAPLQLIISKIRVPIFIFIFSVVFMVPLSTMYYKIDKKIQIFFKR